jgi:outer membrane protein assembly factor BamB
MRILAFAVVLLNGHWQADGLAAEPEPASDRHPPQILEFRRCLWSVPLSAREESARGARPQVAVVRPSVTDSLVLIDDAMGVRAIDLQTGQSAWPSGDDDPGFLITPNDLPPTEPIPGLANVSPTWNGVIPNGRWIGAIANQSLSTSDPAFPSTLVCLDLAAQGRLDWLWHVGRSMRNGWISGPPIATGDHDRIAVPARGAAGSLNVFCLTAAGDLLWRSEEVESPPQAGVVMDTLAYSQDKILVNVSGQQLMALDARTGQRLWRRSFSTRSIHRSEIEGFHPLIPFENHVLAVTASGLASLDAETGNVAWLNEAESISGFWLGIREGMAIVAGDWLWGIDARTGKVLWQTGFNRRGLRTAGQGLFLNGSVIWPTEQELWTVETASGRILQRSPLVALTGISGGNLAIAGQILLIAGPKRLTAFRVEIH